MSYKDKYADAIEGQFYDLENRIMADIVRRIKKTGEITSTADWQLNRLYALGYSSDEVESMIMKALKATWPEMFELYDKVIDWEYVRNKTLYEQINGQFIPYEDNEQLQQWIEAAKAQTADTLKNLTQTMGIVEQINGQMTFLPLTEFYQRTIDAAILDITSGAFDYNSVLKRTVNTLARSGIRTIDYASGYSSRVAVATRRAVMTGITQMTGRITDYNAEKLGTEYYEVAWHANARPSHRVWQGKVWSKEQLVTVCGLGSVTGLCGVNCYHEYYPFFPGISERNWTDEWLREQNAKEDMPRTWRGKEYTAYEATQKQRQMETSMRAQRQKVRLLEQGEADRTDITVAKARYQGQLNEYREFSDAMGLTPQMERVYIDGLGRVAPSQKAYQQWKSEQVAKAAAKTAAAYKNLAKQSNSVIIKSTGEAKNFAQLKDYVKQTYGLEWDDNVDMLDFTSVREGLEGIEHIIKEFPKAQSSFKRIGVEKSGIMCATYSGEINFNPGYYTSRQVVLDAHRPTSFHPKGNSPYGSGCHEAGHILEKALIDQANGGYTFSFGVLSWNDCTYAKSVVSDACKEVKKLPEGKGKVNSQLKREISGYAYDGGPSECMAEAVCDYALNGEKAAPLSREIWKILKKELG